MNYPAHKHHRRFMRLYELGRHRGLPLRMKTPVNHIHDTVIVGANPRGRPDFDTRCDI